MKKFYLVERGLMGTVKESGTEISITPGEVILVDQDDATLDHDVIGQAVLEGRMREISVLEAAVHLRSKRAWDAKGGTA